MGYRNRHMRVGVCPAAFVAALVVAAPANSQPASDHFVGRQQAVLDSLLQMHFGTDGPGAVAVVVRAGEVIYQGATGYANIERRLPMRPSAVLKIASITKQFTAVGILMLVDEGRISLTDPINRFVPGYPTGDTVTVQHLLAHTSGLRNSGVGGGNTTGEVPLDDRIAAVRDQPFQASPGEKFEYSNWGYALLGGIIERASGQSYGEFMRTRIFEPLGMVNTHFDPSPAGLSELAFGYSPASGGWTAAQPYNLVNSLPSGGMVSTVGDLVLWDLAIQRGQLLSSVTWQRAFTGFRLNDGSMSPYAAGWLVSRIGNLEAAEHGGDLPGWHAFAVRVPSERVYVAILTNANWPPAQRANSLALNMASWVLGVPLELPEVPFAPGMLQQYVGVYRIAPNDDRVVRLEDGLLVTQRGSGPVTRLYPAGEDLFGLRGSGGSLLRFIREDGRIVAAVLEPRAGPTNTARRVP
jgi:D-alanyl-D-alanine carboxypeptidase